MQRLLLPAFALILVLWPAAAQCQDTPTSAAEASEEADHVTLGADDDVTGEAPPPEDSKPLFEPEPEPEPAFRIQATLGVWVGALNGNTHTPLAGGEGTTSKHRPSMDEIGLEGYHALPQLDLRIRLFQDHEVVVGHTYLMAKGTDHLTEDLMTHGHLFPAATRVDSQLEMHFFSLLYRPLWLSPSLAGWRFAPQAGLECSTFHYQLDADTVDGRANRYYALAFAWLGILVSKEFNDQLALEVEFNGALGNGSTIFDGAVRVIYTPFRWGRTSLGLVFGLRGMKWRRVDSQPAEQNDPNMTIGAFSDDPWGGFTFGLRLTYEGALDQ